LNQVKLSLENDLQQSCPAFQQANSRLHNRSSFFCFAPFTRSLIVGSRFDPIHALIRRLHIALITIHWRVVISENVELKCLHVHTPIVQNELENIRHAQSVYQLNHDHMIMIENDDDTYLAWLESNPDGFVVNAENPPLAANLRLHRVKCPHISTPERKNLTTNSYLKVCSNIIGELERWAIPFGSPIPCPVCKPRVAVDPVQLSSPSQTTVLPFDAYPHCGRQLPGRRSVTNSRRGYRLELRKLTKQSQCVYCGIDIYKCYEHWLLLQVDHVVPTTMGKRLGISSDWLEDYCNLVLACSACNTFANQFDDKSVTEPPQTLDEFCDLRNRIFLARKPIIQKCQNDERLFFDSKPWGV